MSLNKKLLLINPVNHQRFGLASSPDGPFPPLGLAMVAACTPPGWDIHIIDEHFEPFHLIPADLVGLTAFTATVTRAYEIAAVYRSQGIPTVLGGIHASLLPDEASHYVDSVVIGEAESTWPDILRDFEHGHLAARYTGALADCSRLPLPRRDLLSRHYTISTIQTTRGCPMDCEFCSVPAFNGHQYRMRPIESVLDEMESIPHANLMIVDDNIYGFTPAHRQRALDLFQGMIRRKIKKDWGASVSVNVAGDDEFLHYARASRCRMLTMGIEVEDTEGLRLLNKQANVRLTPQAYPDLFRQINRHGIATSSSFIYGNDTDTPATLKQRTRYLASSPINAIIGTVFLTPLPGTRLYQRLQQEQRLRHTHFPQDWERYDFSEVVFHPKNMTPEELTQSVFYAIHSLFSLKSIASRFFKTWRATRSLISSIWALLMNYRIRRISRDIVSAYHGSAAATPYRGRMSHTKAL